MRSWAVVVAAAVLGSVVLGVLGAPSPVLFGSLGAALILAISPWPTSHLPEGPATVGQALLGISIGATIDPQTLSGFLAHAAPVVVSVVVTVALSILLGQLLRLQGVTPATATFACIAGGASGVTAVAGELGADDRVVAVIQYLRVLIIIVGMPLVAAVLFGAPVSASRPDSGGPVASMVSSSVAAVREVTPSALAFTAISLVLGLVLSRLVRFPASGLLAPLGVAAVLAVTGVLDPCLGVGSAHLPGVLEALAFALIGLQVGLRFTRDSLREVARLLPLATLVILLLIAASAGVGVVLAHGMGLSPLDGYLATTPGGLYAVLLTAAIAGGDVTFVLAVQVVRLLVVLGLAPVLAAHYRRRTQRAEASTTADRGSGRVAQHRDEEAGGRRERP